MPTDSPEMERRMVKEGTDVKEAFLWSMSDCTAKLKALREGDVLWRRTRGSFYGVDFGDIRGEWTRIWSPKEVVKLMLKQLELGKKTDRCYCGPS